MRADVESLDAKVKRMAEAEVRREANVAEEKRKAEVEETVRTDAVVKRKAEDMD